MNIEALIEYELWNSIKQNYNNKDYTGAIEDAIFYIRDLIRDKANLEIDGQDLINQAFSEKNPKIKLNKLLTKHEKNIQTGMRNSLLGIWQLIRNTRSHEKHNDTREDAISVIFYINYLSKMINKAKSSFSVDDFIESVYDEYFEQTSEYAKLLVQEIPNKQKEEVFYKLFSSMNKFIFELENNYGVNAKYELKDNHRKLISLKLVTKELINSFNEHKQTILEKVIKELNKFKICNEFFWKLNILIHEWELFDKRTKLRVRKILLEYTKDYDYSYYKNNIFLDGWKYFDNETRQMIQDKFINTNPQEYEIVDNELKYIGKSISLDKIDIKIDKLLELEMPHFDI